MKVNARPVALLLASLTLAALPPAPAHAMTMNVVDDQLLLSGPVVVDDPARFRALLDANPAVKTVVLSDSPGGAASANDAITDMIEAYHLDTVVTGYCVSACAMIFLSGNNRSFGDRHPLELTSLGFHGSYSGGVLASETRLQSLKQRVLARTAGKIDPALVDRWLHFTDERNSIRFRYPGTTIPSTAPTVFFCPFQRFPNAGQYDSCEPIKDIDALTAGILTSTAIVRVK